MRPDIVDDARQLKPSEQGALELRVRRWFHDNRLPQSRIDASATVPQRRRDLVTMPASPAN